MLKKKNKYLMSFIVSTLLVGCGGGSGGTSETNANSNATTPTSTNGNSTASPTTCASIKQVMESLNETYITTLYNNSTVVAYADKDENDDKDEDKENNRDEENDEGEEDEGGGGVHNQGRACAQCHSKTFDSGATVFTTLTANTGSIGASGYKIQLGNSHVYNSGRGDGNSHLTRYIGGAFTANVIDANGNIVNSSAQGSHDASRLNCNSCHTASGNNGAPGRIVNYRITTASTPVTTATPSTCVSFTANVMPILEVKCKSCHGSNGRFSVSSPNATHANITALKSSMAVAGQYLLDKGSNSIGHGGGAVISGSSAEYTTLKAWLNEGALNN